MLSKPIPTYTEEGNNKYKNEGMKADSIFLLF